MYIYIYFKTNYILYTNDDTLILILNCKEIIDNEIIDKKTASFALMIKYINIESHFIKNHILVFNYQGSIFIIMEKSRHNRLMILVQTISSFSIEVQCC